MIQEDLQSNKDSHSDSQSDIKEEVVNFNGKNTINVINASKTRDDDVLKLLIGFSTMSVSYTHLTLPTIYSV